MATLRATGLRRLVRLYRRGVEGTEAELDMLISERSEELGALLDPDLDVTLLRDEPMRVELLASWVENSRRRNAERRVLRDRDTAVQLALQLARTATPAGELLRVEPAVLASLTTCKSFDYLVPDPDVPTGIERRRLYALLRECRGAEVVDVELWPDRLRLRYRTSVGRGQVMLWHQAVPERRAVLYLPPAREVMHAAEPARELSPAAAPVLEATPSRIPTPSDPGREGGGGRAARDTQPEVPWLRHVFELVAEALP